MIQDMMVKKIGLGLAAAAALSMSAFASANAEEIDRAALVTAAAGFGDAEAGKKIFRRCTACHKVGEGAKNGVGPQLNGVIGRAAGSIEGYKYGTGIMEASEKALVWNNDTLLAYLADPKAYLIEFTGNKKAKAKMVFKLRKEDDRKNVISYLASFAEDGTAAATN